MMSYLQKSAPEIWHVQRGEYVSAMTLPLCHVIGFTDGSPTSHSDKDASETGAAPPNSIAKVATLSKHALEEQTISH
jgi:hypothetical protein